MPQKKQTDSALKILTRAGYLEYTDEQDNASRIMFTLTKEELYRIHEQNADTEKLIRILLRTYTGLFTDYAYINEELLAKRSGLSRPQIYETLLFLTRQHILHYIPGKKTPYIIYTRERQETDRIYLSKEVYEERKESYRRRIEAMIEYAESENKCRSRMLLHYFGEKNEHNCGVCDTCLHYRTRHAKEGPTDQELETGIIRLLEEQAMTPAMVAGRLAEDKDRVAKALRQLLEKERIFTENGMLLLKK